MLRTKRLVIGIAVLAASDRRVITGAVAVAHNAGHIRLRTGGRWNVGHGNDVPWARGRGAGLDSRSRG